MRFSPPVRASFGFVGLALICLIFADIEITTIDPWREMGRLGVGIITPDFSAVERLGDALLQTVSFAILGVAGGGILGFLLATVYHIPVVRPFCAFIRSIHEIFWALIFLQGFGLTPLTGVLAIAIPYAGIFAKVYSEILEEADARAIAALPAGTSHLSSFFFVRLPDVRAHLKTYSFYRLECALRSSAVLGFVGLPTLGFHLETAFKQGHYSEVSALLIVFYLLIATIRFWVRPKYFWLYVLAAPFALKATVSIEWSNVVRFFTQDIIPSPLRRAETIDFAAISATGDWFWRIMTEQALPGIVSTLLLTQIALVATGVLTLLFFPLISQRFFGLFGRNLGHVFLVVVRSTPEYILAYILLQLWGPSMFPAIVALALHNGAIVGHLIGRHTEELPQRADAPRGLNLYAYEVLPRVYGQFLAFLFYRWEVILRETAILGILGVATLGFYIDSAFEDIRFDVALVLILITAALNIVVDIISRNIRARLRLTTTADAG